MPPFIVAIDGPSGAGKGTVARAVARALGFMHVDTGAMYRAVAWKAVQEGLPLDDANSIAQLAERSQIRLEKRVLIDGHDVTTAIRTAEIDRASAAVAKLPAVRRVLVGRQRALVRGQGVVVEGRDIGTVVFPKADVKIYLDAEPVERARRRAADPAHAGDGQRPVADVATALQERDATDRARDASPLSRAPDAVLVDTTRLSIDEVVRRVLAIVKTRLGHP